MSPLSCSSRIGATGGAIAGERASGSAVDCTLDGRLRGDRCHRQHKLRRASNRRLQTTIAAVLPACSSRQHLFVQQTQFLFSINIAFLLRVKSRRQIVRIARVVCRQVAINERRSCAMFFANRQWHLRSKYTIQIWVSESVGTINHRLLCRDDCRAVRRHH